MEARTMNARTWAQAAARTAAVAAALMMTGAPVSEATTTASMMSREAAMRTLMCYGEGAWMAPTAVILKSERDWNEWNDAMLEAGRSVSSVKAPAGIDWAKEAVLVVALGQSEQNATLTLKSARRVGLRTEVELEMTWGAGGTSPCHVVAMDKRLLKNVRLQNAEAAGLASQVQAYTPNAAVAKADGMATPVAVMASWGAVKAEYRQ
jgi:hypothetical protein